jgi:hypothetical protein
VCETVSPVEVARRHGLALATVYKIKSAVKLAV